MEIHPIIVQPFIAVFQALDKIVASYFGSHPVNGSIPSLLKNFKKAYLALEISVTLKVNVLIVHLIPCLTNLNG